MENYTSLCSWISALEIVLQGSSVSYKEVLERANIDPEILNGPYERVDVAIIKRVWAVALELTHEDSLGILSAPLCQPVHWHALGLAMLCSRSIGEALQRVCQFQEILSNVVAFSFKRDEKSFHLFMRSKIPIEEVGLGVVDFGFAGLLSVCRSIYPDAITPTYAALERPKPQNTQPFEDFYGCPVVFGCEVHHLSIPLALADRVLDHSDPLLAENQDSLAADYILRIVKSSMTLRTQDAIKERLPSGEPCQTKVAEALCVSPRKLQRMLQKEGSSFKSLLRSVRMELAQRYLHQQYRSITEVALLLGFADHSNFTRAFKAWFDCTPSQYRELCQSKMR